MAGRRVNFAELAASTGTNSVVDGARQPKLAAPAGAREVPLADLAPNPRNPRHRIDVSDLESIRELQLQPALVVTRAVYLQLWPEDADALGAAKYVVINGCRRLLAAQTYGRTTLEVVMKNEVARDRATLRAAAIRENVDREDLDVIEEADAVEALVRDAGTAAAAAQALGKTEAWVSQRRALLKLAPELQDKLRAGELAIRVARSLAQVPLEQQVERWQAQLAERDPASTTAQPRAMDAARIAKAVAKWQAEPSVLAAGLAAHLDRDSLETLVDELRAQLETGGLNRP